MRRKFSSYFNLYLLVKIHLPSLKTLRVEFLQQILANEKEVFEITNVPPCMATEKWPEWAVKNIWPQVKDIEIIHRYMPDSLWEGNEPIILLFEFNTNKLIHICVKSKWKKDSSSWPMYQTKKEQGSHGRRY